MRALIAGLGAAGTALFGAALTTTATASAHTDDETVFIATLGDKNIHYSSEDDAIKVGREVCNWITSGWTPRNIATQMDRETTLSRNQALYFVSTSVIAFCTERMPLLAADPAF